MAGYATRITTGKTNQFPGAITVTMFRKLSDQACLCVTTSFVFVVFASSLALNTSFYLSAVPNPKPTYPNDERFKASSQWFDKPLTVDRIPEAPIFLMETSNRSSLSPRELCSIESAAKHLPVVG